MARSPQPDKRRHVGPSKAQGGTTAGASARTDEKLDEALKATFPASDPFSLTVYEDPNSRATYASPPSFMHELDPSYLGLPPREDAGSPEPADPTEGASEAQPPDVTRAKKPDAG